MKHISEFFDEALRELFEERAAIMEHDGGIPREKAEALAMAEAQSWAAHREAMRGKS